MDSGLGLLPHNIVMKFIFNNRLAERNTRANPKSHIVLLLFISFVQKEQTTCNTYTGCSV